MPIKAVESSPEVVRVPNRFTVIAVAAALLFAACGTAEQTGPSVASSSTTAQLPVSSSTAETSQPTTVEVPATPEPVDVDANASPRLSGTFGAAVLRGTPDAAATSGRFEAVMTMIPGLASGIDGDVTILMSGAFAANGDSELSIDMGNLFALGAAGAEDIPEEFADMFAEPMEMKLIGEKSYVKWGFFTMFFGTDKWIEGAADDSEGIKSGFGFGTDGDSPTQLLEALSDASAEVEDLGQEDVRGVSTTHYRAVLDLSTLEEHLSEEELAELGGDIGDIDMVDFPIDIWIGEDGDVYRYSVEVDASTAGADTDDFLGMTMMFEMWDYGADIVIEAPPPEEIATEDEIGFSFDA